MVQMEVKLFSTSLYYQENGLNKILYKSVKHVIKTMTNEENLSYAKIVDRFLFLYNNTPHNALGDTPYFTFIGFDGMLPGYESLTASIDKENRA